MWLRLDNSKADDVEEAKKKYKMYVRQGLNPLFRTNEDGVVDVYVREVYTFKRAIIR